jgi:aspartyl aminopeptidase
MHSIREHTGTLDPFLLFRTIEQFLKSETHRKLPI